jgi:hypothetical protein
MAVWPLAHTLRINSGQNSRMTAIMRPSSWIKRCTPAGPGICGLSGGFPPSFTTSFATGGEISHSDGWRCTSYQHSLNSTLRLAFHSAANAERPMQPTGLPGCGVFEYLSPDPFTYLLASVVREDAADCRPRHRSGHRASPPLLALKSSSIRAAAHGLSPAMDGLGARTLTCCQQNKCAVTHHRYSPCQRAQA